MLWHNKKEKIVEKEVFVPIAINDRRTYIEKWSDTAYLTRVIEMCGTEIYKTEVLQVLSNLKTTAMQTESHELWKGIQASIRCVNRLLTLREYAEKSITAINAERNVNV